MADLGYVDGKSYQIDAWWGDGSTARLEKMAAEILAAKPEVLVTQGGSVLIAMLGPEFQKSAKALGSSLLLRADRVLQ